MEIKFFTQASGYNYLVMELRENGVFLKNQTEIEIERNKEKYNQITNQQVSHLYTAAFILFYFFVVMWT